MQSGRHFPQRKASLPLAVVIDIRFVEIIEQQSILNIFIEHGFQVMPNAVARDIDTVVVGQPHQQHRLRSDHTARYKSC